MLGRSVGNYQLVSKIGEGGMGAVYLAQHMTLGRRAAVKVLLPELSSNQDVVSRFFNEARAATAIRNPGIVEVFDFGFFDDRCAYIVMEYLDGESLAARIRRGRSTVLAMLTTLRAIARALQAAHDLGIVHRDLKPDNVFLVPDAELPSGERVKLLDFGIAKLASGVSEMGHTRTGTVMGTPTYMSPEQCRGAGSVDHRADLYSLGCVAYEMLCGQPPFVAEGSGEIIARHLYFQPEPLRVHRPDLRPEVEALVLWLLQKDPGARPSTATDVVHSVDRLTAGASAVALRGELMVNGIDATRPPVMDTTRPPVMDTTLSGAASVNAVPKNGTTSTRVRMIAGAATAAIALLVIILWARGHQDDGDTGSITGTPAVQSDPTGRDIAALAPGAPIPRDVAPKTVAADAPDSRSPVAAGTPMASPVGSAGDAITPTNPAKPTAATSPEPGKPAAATTSSDTAKPSDAETPPEVAKPGGRTAMIKASDAAKPTATATSVDSGKPAEAAKRSVAAKQTDTAKAPGAACMRAAFAPVLDVEAPGEAAVQGALGRLRQCKATMKAELYAEIQRQLIAKL